VARAFELHVLLKDCKQQIAVIQDNLFLQPLRISQPDRRWRATPTGATRLILEDVLGGEGKRCAAPI
jgi:hypothetical protein